MTSTHAEHPLPAPPPTWSRPARKTASTITDPELDVLYAQRDALLRLLAGALAAGATA
ncbi:hypothetical protein ACFWP7_17045 [Streptomyces sp. NPDC058470]|uniref:hypothetical protein n=1 Tax=unclassified Streptomyces TaxID=2593676 RepID=UPI002E2D9CC5|nr:hypothetical protein [Streptomyces sp. NBC_00239]